MFDVVNATGSLTFNTTATVFNPPVEHVAIFSTGANTGWFNTESINTGAFNIGDMNNGLFTTGDMNTKPLPWWAKAACSSPIPALIRRFRL